MPAIKAGMVVVLALGFISLFPLSVTAESGSAADGIVAEGIASQYQRAAIKNKKKRTFTLGVPARTTPKQELADTRAFIPRIIAKVEEISAKYATDWVQRKGMVPKVYSQATADRINRRDNLVKNRLLKALGAYDRTKERLSNGKKLKRRKAFVPALPFGKPFKKLPKRTNLEALRLTRIMLGQMESYNYRLMEALEGLLTDTGKKSRSLLSNAAIKTLLTALERDLNNGIKKQASRVGSFRYSTKGISGWSAKDVADNADNKVYKGSGLEVYLGIELDLEVGATLQGNQLVLNFKQRDRDFVVRDCIARTTLQPGKAAVFEGPLEAGKEAFLSCGKINGRIDTKGRISGKVYDFPPPGWWGMDYIDFEGLINKDGTLCFTSRTALREGVEDEGGQIHGEAELSR